MLAGIISGVQALLGRLTATRAGYLDKLNITGNVPSATYYTNALGTQLSSNVDTQITTRARQSDALSSSIWTSPLATRLNTLRRVPQIKIQTNGIVAGTTAMGTAAATKRYFYHQAVDAAIAVNRLDADYKFGFRVIESNDATDVLINVINVTGGGWVFGVNQYNSSNSTAYSSQVTIIADGITLYDSTYASLGANTMRLAIGKQYYISGEYYALVADVLMLKYDGVLQVQHRSPNAAVYTSLIYVPD
jgi:hypothetical protein